MNLTCLTQHVLSLLWIDVRRPFLTALTIRGPFAPDNPYLNTSWRNKPSWYGGLFIDSLVHGSAMVRAVLLDNTNGDDSDIDSEGVSKIDLSSVNATTSSQADFLPGVDTMTATFQWNNKRKEKIDVDVGQGVLSVTYACTVPMYEMEVTGTGGSAILRRRIDANSGRPVGYDVIVTTPGDATKNQPTQQTQTNQFPFRGLDGEFTAFAKTCCQLRAVKNDGGETTESVKLATRQDLNTPREALADLAFVEACLESGRRRQQQRTKNAP
jgi:predicted dehydrogenase